ncbi:succinylglutamate desuccinylase/aspartoacylase family protein [Ferrimonas balearica]|uniref:succinylglutamate desuccinylase/aspartoacylase family protein n=1 Tax=Ferrimonas balearica TaxID=44012 RepID=UPI001C97CE0C|nr:succinylglutamate desuccinylase/aspartoacylase family protein [Ferrimonas balearica]MBY5979316.1 succinylglutamate desuccinylase/aspartoacylase family protein [Ferrimonas balearica]
MSIEFDTQWPTQAQRQRGLLEWVKAQPRPCWLTWPGRDPSRHRVVVTLLHGNEPSGLKALWTLMASPPQCAVTSHFCIAHLEAARLDGGFVHRHAPGRPDLNRCFGRAGLGWEYGLAHAIAERIRSLQPEAVVDLHNTSGSGPSFAVSMADTPAHRALASRFTERMLRTQVRLGALMELTTPQTPIVTIECGGAMDPASDEVARAGLLRFLADDLLLDEPRGAWPLEVLHRPVRVQLAPGCRIDYGVGPVDGCDLVLPPDIEQCNFGWLDGGTELGWLGPDGLGALRLSDGLGELAVEQWFVEREGRLCLRQPGKLFMITSNPSIALSDCLFYMVKA